MASGMNRRHWLRSLFGLVASAWAAGRAPAAGPPPAPLSVTTYDLAPAGLCRCQVTTCTYDGASRLTCTYGPVTTYRYDGPGSIRYDG